MGGSWAESSRPRTSIHMPRIPCPTHLPRTAPHEEAFAAMRSSALPSHSGGGRSSTTRCRP